MDGQNGNPILRNIRGVPPQRRIAILTIVVVCCTVVITRPFVFTGTASHSQLLLYLLSQRFMRRLGGEHIDQFFHRLLDYLIQDGEHGSGRLDGQRGVRGDHYYRAMLSNRANDNDYLIDLGVTRR